MASLDRRRLLAAAPYGLLAACEARRPMTASTTPPIKLAAFETAVLAVAQVAMPGKLGVGLMNLENGESYLFNAERRFPMQSVFKLPLATAVLSEVDGGRLALTERFELTETQLSLQVSPIATAWPARSTYSALELLEALLIDSDNTAADVLMKRIGGPGALTAWLESERLTGIRVDRYERELQPQSLGMGSFRPAWRDSKMFETARAEIPSALQSAAFRAYMLDPRDTSTPRGMLAFLQALARNDLCSIAATERLQQLMTRTRRGANRLAAGLPSGVVLAHRPGTSNVQDGVSAAHNDVGIFTLADRRAYAICVFLTGSTLDSQGRDKLIASIAAAALRAVG